MRLERSVAREREIVVAFSLKALLCPLHIAFQARGQKRTRAHERESLNKLGGATRGGLGGWVMRCAGAAAAAAAAVIVGVCVWGIASVPGVDFDLNGGGGSSRALCGSCICVCRLRPLCVCALTCVIRVRAAGGEKRGQNPLGLWIKKRAVVSGREGEGRECFWRARHRRRAAAALGVFSTGACVCVCVRRCASSPWKKAPRESACGEEEAK